MMKHYRYLAAILCGAMLAAGCDDMKKLDKEYISDNPIPPVLNSHDPIVINKENQEETATFTWTKADYGFSAADEYTLYGQGSTGDPVRISSSTGASMKVANKDINRAVLLISDVKPNEENKIKIFVLSSLNTSLQKSVKSNETELTVTPYKVKYPESLYMPGNYQGWSPATAHQIYPTTEDNLKGEYEGFLKLTKDGTNEPEFKFTGQPDWNPLNWGSSFENLVPGGGNFTHMGAAFYRLRVSLSTLKAESLTTTGIRIIGEAVGGWNDASEVDLTPDGTNPYLWKVTGQNFAAGEWKIRFNRNWDHALGGTLDNATFSGGNFAGVAAGAYDVTLDLSKFPYKITMTKQ